uniref:Uncharacterized protein n=1 Tax=Anguilla anguilla TaxID=7936 RepID=A0A0E9WUP9_ANGAN
MHSDYFKKQFYKCVHTPYLQILTTNVFKYFQTLSILDCWSAEARGVFFKKSLRDTFKCILKYFDSTYVFVNTFKNT